MRRDTDDRPLAVLVAWLVTATPLGLDATAQTTRSARSWAKALKDGKISLQQGVTASAKEGKPISAKYEVEDGKLQLSVYTMKGDAFSEVIVDHKTGRSPRRSRSPRPMTSPAAKAQNEAIAKAKRSLATAASEAVKENKGIPCCQRHAERERGTSGGRCRAGKGHRVEDGVREARFRRDM